MPRIVYAEDDDLVAEHVRETLSAAGHIVGIVDNGLDAFEAIKLKRPDLVILDAQMPGLPGPEVLRRIRADATLYRTPVLMLTARRSKGDEELARFAGASEYLRKPYDPEKLVSVVTRLLDQRTHRQAALG